METESLQEDDCFKESLIYSDSENSDVDETNDQVSKTSTAQMSQDDVLPNKNPTEEPHSNENRLSSDSDEDDFNKSIRNVKKNARILCSEDENDNDGNETQINGTSTQFEGSGGDNTTDHQAKINVRPSICDSDTKSSGGNQSDAENTPTTKSFMKKLKKKKKKKHEPRKRVISNQSDSESNDENTDKSDKKQKKTAKLKHTSDQSGSSGSSGSRSGSGSDSNSTSESDSSSRGKQKLDLVSKDVKPREKIAQRMSAKMAEEQMKEIQSESQRMARQLPVTIPYHRPKQHSLKEFLSRRSIIRQQKKLECKPMPKAAVGIKMSKDELTEFINEMERRTQEAEEFFQEQEEEFTPHSAIKSDDSEDDDWTDKSKMKETKLVLEEKTETPEIGETQINEIHADASKPPSSPPPISPSVSSENVIECTEVTDIIDNDNQQDNQTIEKQPTALDPEPLVEAANIIEFHTDRTELDDELDAMLTSETLSKKSISAIMMTATIPTDYVPKLKGEDGFVIDLETNDMKPKSQDGVQELLSRFVQSACVKKHVNSETQNVGIFQSNTGTVETHQFHVNMDEKPNIDVRPGESLLKLRSELSKKIKENREKLIAQRLQEQTEHEIAQKQIESEEEELVDEEEEEDDRKETDHVMEMEAMECDENEESEIDENSDQSDSEAINNLDMNTEATKPRKRIVSMDDDSDDEQSLNVAAIEGDNQISEGISEMIEIQASHQTLDESFKTTNNDTNDLSALESEILQLDNESNVGLNKSETSKFFQDSNADDEINDSQLMALCSGSFATQYPENLTGQSAHQPIQNDESTKAIAQQDEVVKKASSPKKHLTETKSALLSSDDEETENKDLEMTDKVKKKRKKQTLVYSDDEEDIESATASQQLEDPLSDSAEVLEEQIDDEEEDFERYIEYDSDENEVEVERKKKDVRKNDFFEDEAELSGSELGSGDEDETEMDRYEKELGDADKFDKNKLRDELERIRLREQIDEDAREIRVLTERFVEEEDSGQERERKFRWKHLNNGDMDDGPQNIDQDATGGVLNNSDDENEVEWRRIRYEREQLLKQQIKDNDSVIEQTSDVLEVTEQRSAETNIFTLNASSTKRISFIKPVATPKVSSPFLISKNDLCSGHLSRKSFLNRDSPILEKLAGLSKSGSDGDAILNKTKGKGNYVFVATEKKESSKRKSENNMGIMTAEPINPSKKSKLESQKIIKIRPHTKAFFESLN